jgi:hypothetical protein
MPKRKGRERTAKHSPGPVSSNPIFRRRFTMNGTPLPAHNASYATYGGVEGRAVSRGVDLWLFWRREQSMHDAPLMLRGAILRALTIGAQHCPVVAPPARDPLWDAPASSIVQQVCDPAWRMAREL